MNKIQYFQDGGPVDLNNWKARRAMRKTARKAGLNRFEARKAVRGMRDLQNQGVEYFSNGTIKDPVEIPEIDESELVEDKFVGDPYGINNLFMGAPQEVEEPEEPVVPQTPTKPAFDANKARQQRYAGYDNLAIQMGLANKGDDSKTIRTKVAEWQAANGLVDDGLFGKNSQAKWAELQAASQAAQNQELVEELNYGEYYPGDYTDFRGNRYSMNPSWRKQEQPAPGQQEPTKTTNNLSPLKVGEGHSLSTWQNATLPQQNLNSENGGGFWDWFTTHHYNPTKQKQGGKMNKINYFQNGGVQIGNSKRTKLLQHGSYDNSQFGKGQEGLDKVRALQRLIYANNMPGVVDDRIDGKWGNQTSSHFANNGWQMGAGGANTITSKSGLTYVYDPETKSYYQLEEEPQQQPSRVYSTTIQKPKTYTGVGDNRPAEEWSIDLDNLTDMQARDLANFKKLHPGKTDEDWVNTQFKMRKRNNQVIDGANRMGAFTRDLMNLAVAAGSTGARTTRSGHFGSNNVRTTKPEQWTNPLKNVRHNATQGKTIGKGGVRKMGDKVVGSRYSATDTEPRKLYRYTVGTVRGGKNVGGSWTTETPRVDYTQVTSFPVAPWLNEQAPNVIEHKQGGIMEYFDKNKKIKFQQGGAAPQGGDVQEQIIRLVQAAQQGDQEAAQVINDIMQKAQSGDQQAVQIAQLIQQVMQQTNGQAMSAKYGAKVNYLRSLSTGCPEGTTPYYFKNGGHLCKECLTQSQIEEKKCGGKTKKKACGGPVQPKKAACGKKLVAKCGGKAKRGC